MESESRTAGKKTVSPLARHVAEKSRFPFSSSRGVEVVSCSLRDFWNPAGHAPLPQGYYWLYGEKKLYYGINGGKDRIPGTFLPRLRPCYPSVHSYSFRSFLSGQHRVVRWVTLSQREYYFYDLMVEGDGWDRIDSMRESSPCCIPLACIQASRADDDDCGEDVREPQPELMVVWRQAGQAAFGAHGDQMKR
ncbi:hypothetical protein VTO42DRAFT_6900 [Malbranchea cinnamomea]